MERRISRSTALLCSALDRGELTRDDVVHELALSPGDLEAVIAGERVLSLPHQLCLAALLIERVPRLARRARTLRAQATAAIAVTKRERDTRPPAPTAWRVAR